MSSIPLTGAGGLFTRFGTMVALASAVNVNRGSVIPGLVGELQQEFTDTDQNIIDSLYTYLLAYQNSGTPFTGNIQVLAQNTVIQMANEAVPQPNSLLQAAIQLLVSQMKASSNTVKSCVVGASASPYPTNLGNAAIVVSSLDANGAPTQYQFSENATATISSDYQQSYSLLGVEPVTLRTPQSVQNMLSWLYPAGSGITLSFSSVSALLGGRTGTQNWLVNGAMESFTASANIPDSWHILTGTPGSTVYRATAAGTFYDGTSAVSFHGNGSELTALYQAFTVPGASYDTQATLYPTTQFAVNLAIKMDAATASGVLRVSLSNASGVISDNSGNPNALSINLNTVGTSYQIFNSTFRSPSVLPTPPCYLELALTTPLPSPRVLYIDHVSFCQMNQFYRGGPSVVVFSGNLPSIAGDSFGLDLSNDYGGQLQYYFDRFFGMKALGLILPSAPSGSETIPDTLI